MPTTEDSQFCHRPDPFSRFTISFCKVCLQTVARESSEIALLEGERQHECAGLPAMPRAAPQPGLGGANRS